VLRRRVFECQSLPIRSAVCSVQCALGSAAVRVMTRRRRLAQPVKRRGSSRFFSSAANSHGSFIHSLISLSNHHTHTQPKEFNQHTRRPPLRLLDPTPRPPPTPEVTGSLGGQSRIDSPATAICIFSSAAMADRRNAVSRHAHTRVAKPDGRGEDEWGASQRDDVAPSLFSPPLRFLHFFFASALALSCVRLGPCSQPSVPVASPPRSLLRSREQHEKANLVARREGFARFDPAQINEPLTVNPKATGMHMSGRSAPALSHAMPCCLRLSAGVVGERRLHSSGRVRSGCSHRPGGSALRRSHGDLCACLLPALCPKARTDG